MDRDANGDYEEDYVEVYMSQYDNMVICTLQNTPVLVEQTRNKFKPDKYYGKCMSSYHLQTHAEEVYVYIPKNVITDNQKLSVFTGPYSDNVYENEEYYYFENSSVKDDTKDIETSFSFSWFVGKK